MHCCCGKTLFGGNVNNITSHLSSNSMVFKYYYAVAVHIVLSASNKVNDFSDFIVLQHCTNFFYLQ